MIFSMIVLYHNTQQSVPPNSTFNTIYLPLLFVTAYIATCTHDCVAYIFIFIFGELYCGGVPSHSAENPTHSSYTTEVVYCGRDHLLVTPDLAGREVAFSLSCRINLVAGMW